MAQHHLHLDQWGDWMKCHYPIQIGDPLPPERKTVLVWCEGPNSALPYCGYLRYGAGDRFSPYFVVYHGNPDRPSSVIAWSDCLPDKPPAGVQSSVYEDRGKRDWMARGNVRIFGYGFLNSHEGFASNPRAQKCYEPTTTLTP